MHTTLEPTRDFATVEDARLRLAVILARDVTITQQDIVNIGSWHEWLPKK